MSLFTNLVSVWEMNETGTGTRGDSHNSNILTNNNSLTNGVGKLGNASDFEASLNQSLSCNDNVSLSTGDVNYAFSTWVNFESHPTVSIILSKDHFAVGREYALYIYQPLNILEWIVFDGTNSIATVDWASGIPATGGWHHIFVWHSATLNQVGMSVDNATDQVVSTTGAAADTSIPFRIGADGLGSGRTFDGLIDQTAFWKGGIPNSTDRTALYNSGNGLAYSSWGGGGGTLAKDIFGRYGVFNSIVK